MILIGRKINYENSSIDSTLILLTNQQTESLTIKQSQLTLNIRIVWLLYNLYLVPLLDEFIQYTAKTYL